MIVDKFEIEKKILFSIYSEEKIKDYIEKNETPDFIITDSKNQKKIGIEVTRLFVSQSSAARRSNEFCNKFINEYKPGVKKKKRKSFLKRTHVVKLESDIAEGPVQKDYVIIEEVSLKDYLDFLENLISKKNDSYLHPKEELEYTNLFIFDEDNFLKRLPFEITDIYKIIRSHSVFDTIINSNFQEIILFTEFKSGFYPINLKWVIFVNEFYLYKHFWKNELAISTHQKNDFYLMIKHFCATIHILFNFTKVYLAFNENNERIIIFGTSYWVFNENEFINEGAFLALELKEDRLIKNVIPKHIKNSTTHVEYAKYRLTLVPNLQEGMFYKKDR